MNDEAAHLRPDDPLEIVKAGTYEVVDPAPRPRNDADSAELAAHFQEST